MDDKLHRFQKQAKPVAVLTGSWISSRFLQGRRKTKVSGLCCYQRGDLDHQELGRLQSTSNAGPILVSLVGSDHSAEC